MKIAFETKSSFYMDPFLDEDLFHLYLPSIKFSSEGWIFRAAS